MTAGRLAMIVCPMLEDELIYNIENEKEEKKVYLVKTPYNTTIIPKFRQHDVEYELVEPVKVLMGLIPKDEFSIIVWLMNLGLHEDPDLLKMEVRNQIVMLMNSVDAVFLYYARCGRGMDDIEWWCQSMRLPIPVTLFKNYDGTICDDCICIPVGGTENYLRLLKAHAGQIYLTPAMTTNFEGLMGYLNLMNGIDTDVYEIMKMLLDMAGYEVALKVQTGMGDQEHYEENAVAFAEKYKLRLETLEDGWVDSSLTDRNYERAKKMMVDHIASRGSS